MTEIVGVELNPPESLFMKALGQILFKKVIESEAMS